MITLAHFGLALLVQLSLGVGGGTRTSRNGGGNEQGEEALISAKISVVGDMGVGD